MPRPALAFDMFGTLADPASYADGLREFVANPTELAATWRHHQLEISWLLSVAEQHRDWPTVTAHALDMTLTGAGAELSTDQRDVALAHAGNPTLFDEVADCLRRLRTAGFELAVFSNGDAGGLERILDANGIAEMFTAVVSCEEVGVYKPAPATYRHLAERLRRPIAQVWLVSGNPFDCAGAGLAGMRVARVDRAPAIGYPFAPAPDAIVPSLAQLPATISDRL